ncbi:unnamed protein product [Fraxinus pennsylvanica]|uniref:Uncharacterized protein n=1 Tax=Fraxinus pennsylvanica TaxID=56036 RepID=A0AAD2DL46_9LAMI|nr:unnamed protein product [Fraxinus pennsylvanica]
MSKFLSEILLPILMREAGMCDVVEENMMIKTPNMIIGKLQINNIENNCGLVEDVEEEEEFECGETEQDDDGDADADADDDDYASKKLKENSVKKIIEKKCEAALEVKLRVKFLKKPVVEDPLGNDSIITSSEFSTERKRKSCKRKAKSIGTSGEGSSSRNNKKRCINPREEPAPPLPVQFKNAVLALAQGRTVSEVKLVIQKQLFASDMASDQNRFTIPENQIREEFLSNEEKINLSKYIGNIMQLWAVRVDEELLFVLVKVA